MTMQLDDDELRVLSIFRPYGVDWEGKPIRSPQSLIRTDDDLVGQQLAAKGLLDRDRKPGRGGGWWYAITDAGIAALPSEDESPARRRTALYGQVYLPLPGAVDRDRHE